MDSGDKPDRKATQIRKKEVTKLDTKRVKI